jgi:type II secretion system protein H
MKRGHAPEHMVQRIMQKSWKKQTWTRNRQQGFSLIELLVVIGIAAIIAAIGIPSLLGIRDRSNLRESASDVMSAFKKAQAEAVKRNSSVGVIFGARTCTTFIDDGTGGGIEKNVILDGAEETVSVTTLQLGNSFNNNTFPAVNGGQKNIEFNSRGLPAFIGGQTSVGSIDITGGVGSHVQYRVAINLTGHVNLLVSTDSGASFK